MTVFSFKGWFKGDGWEDLDDLQVRYVVAETEEEAEAKMDEWCKQMVADGYAKFIYQEPTVEVDNVIV